MTDLLGIIAPLRKFLSNTHEVISVPIDQTDKEILSLSENRIYNIPDFQREIRWTIDNIALLIDDIESGPKYLGNIILTQHQGNKYFIIDGQQRITVLTMILSCIKQLHDNNIDIITPCTLQIESFEKFSLLLTENFPSDKIYNIDILNSDKLHQINKYYDLWSYISVHPSIRQQRNAQKFIENLGKSSVNIILNKSDDINDSIRYFIDVNLKGKQLDTEDIFKSYLFKNDISDDIREAWYQFKTKVSKADETKLNYPLLKFLEHYFYCDLYKDSKYKGMEFGEDFLLKKEFVTKDDSTQVYRQGIHIIELIRNKHYMLQSIQKLNRAIEIMIEIVCSDSTTTNFESYFKYVRDSEEKIDSMELKIIHNLMSKILKDKNILPKALIMKYILSTLLNKELKSKSEYRKIYGVYLLSVLFVVFENKKSKDLILNVLKADDSTWYGESISQINSYFSLDKITDNRILAQFKLSANENEEDYRFRCKSLATIYNYFEIKNDIVKIKVHSLPQLNHFITNSDHFSTEHFIISNNSNYQTKIIFEGAQLDYKYDERFYKKHVNNLFNFIFVSEAINQSLSNFWLPHKLELIDKSQVKCDYTLMVLEKANYLSQQLQSAVKSQESYKNDLDLFFARDFKDVYVDFARSVLKTVIEKIKG